MCYNDLTIVNRKGTTMFVDDNRLKDLIKMLHEETLLCPPTQDFNSPLFDSDCSGECKECWFKYLDPQDMFVSQS